MSSRHVLTVNQVLEIMLRWLDVQDWENAFMEIIPKRKLPKLQYQERKTDQEGDASTPSVINEPAENPSEGSDFRLNYQT
jgi:hypothetical protein